jgi:ligand-binding sensor domain-containing protein
MGAKTKKLANFLHKWIFFCTFAAEKYATPMRRILFLIIVFSIQFSVFSFGVSAQNYSLRFYDDSDGLSHWHTTRTLQDSTGMIWIATYNGLNRFDGYRFVAFKAADGDGLSMSSDRIRKLELT